MNFACGILALISSWGWIQALVWILSRMHHFSNFTAVNLFVGMVVWGFVTFALWIMMTEESL